MGGCIGGGHEMHLFGWVLRRLVSRPRRHQCCLLARPTRFWICCCDPWIQLRLPFIVGHRLPPTIAIAPFAPQPLPPGGSRSVRAPWRPSPHRVTPRSSCFLSFLVWCYSRVNQSTTVWLWTVTRCNAIRVLNVSLFIDLSNCKHTPPPD